MHIVHLETGRHIYGGARQVLMLLDGLTKQGIKCTLICPIGSAIASAVSGASEVVTLPMHGDLDPGFVRRFGNWLDGQSPDLIHVHSRRGADLWGGLAASRRDLPAVLSRRVDNPELPLLGKIKYRCFDRIVAISAAIGRQLLVDGVPEAHVRVVHSAVDPATCDPEWSREQFLQAFGLQAGHRAVVCIGQLIRRKGHADLFRAWPGVLAARPEARLILFGQGAEEASLRTLASQLNISDTVHFAGFRQDLRQFVGCADLLVHPAHKEGLGISVLEAQAAGLPVVATRAGGLPEAVADGVTGLLVEPKNPLLLRDALIRLLSDEHLYKTMRAAGPRHVATNFSPASMVSGNLAVYEELLNKHQQ